MFSKNLISWYNKNKRDLPWRHTRNPYFIWLSEIILQQTRVAQGLPYYERFIAKYPTINDLAADSEDNVLRLWQGLGYYSRGRNLLKTAKIIVDDHNGVFPDTYSKLLNLKGIGPYTAAAISSFAFNEHVPVVDGNVMRVICRFFNINKPIDDLKVKTEIFNICKSLQENCKPDLFNQAIMEYGAMVCKPKNPNCDTCVLSIECAAKAAKTIDLIPFKTKKIKIKIRHFQYLVFKKNEKIFFNKRSSGDVWENLYDFKLIEKKDLDLKLELESLGINAGLVSIKTKLHILTHQKLYLNFHLLKLENNLNPELGSGKFYDVNEIENLPKPIAIANYLKEIKFFQSSES